MSKVTQRGTTTDMNEQEQRDQHIGVMVTPSMRKKLERLARERDGRASVSSAVYDILTSFFEKPVSDETQFVATIASGDSH